MTCYQKTDPTLKLQTQPSSAKNHPTFNLKKTQLNRKPPSSLTGNHPPKKHPPGLVSGFLEPKPSPSPPSSPKTAVPPPSSTADREGPRSRPKAKAKDGFVGVDRGVGGRQ